MTCLPGALATPVETEPVCCASPPAGSTLVANIANLLDAVDGSCQASNRDDGSGAATDEMGNGIFGGRNDDEEEEAAEQKALEKWRPELFGHGSVTVKKKLQAQGSQDDLSIDGDDMSVASSVSQMEEEKEVVRAEEEAADEDEAQDQEKGSQQEGSHKEGAGSDSEDGFDPEEEAAAKRDEARRRKKIIVRMEFEPLLSLHEPLGATAEEPAEIFSVGKGGKRNKRLEEAALEDAKVAYRAKSKVAAGWLLEMGLEDCLLAELAQGVGEDPNELRFALEQSKRFIVDDDLVVEKTLVQKVFDVMESDIETMTEVLNKLGEAEEAGVRLAVRDSLGELKIRVANDIELIERVDPEEGTCAEFEVDLVETEQDASELEIQNQASQLREARADSWQLCQMPRALILLAMSLSVAAAAWTRDCDLACIQHQDFQATEQRSDCMGVVDFSENGSTPTFAIGRRCASSAERTLSCESAWRRCQEEQRARREEEKLQRAKEKMERKKELQKRRRKRGRKGEEEQEAESESSDEDGGPQDVADKKALAFRRLQVQIKIEEFLKAYTRGQNLVKINAKGKRYARRVYVDTAKRALVIQGANGPKFFPFASMKEVDLETRTTKEGRVETLVICAIEKDGRIVKELTLAFPDQSKASTFVNCVTLFSLALRRKQD
eukprot:s125_g16.t3